MTKSKFRKMEGNFIANGNLNTQRNVQYPVTKDEENENCWYQLDGASAHSSGEVYNELNNMFDDRWIGRNGPWRWPARSPNLTPLDFYLWGHLKSVVYSSPVNTRQELQERVINAINSLHGAQLLRATTQEVQRRVEKCLMVNGAHIEQLL